MYYVATNGNNTTGDGSILNPWLTIQHAITTIESIPPTSTTQPVINIAPGTYVENITFTKGYISMISPYNGKDYTLLAKINGNVLINITDADDLYSKQVIIQGIQIIGTVTDTSTKKHTLTLQDCYIYSDGRALYQNSTADCRTRVYNSLVNSDTTLSTDPLVEISAGDAYFDRVDFSYKGDGNVLLVNGTGVTAAAVYATLCDFTSSTSSTSAPGVTVVSVQTTRACTFGYCLFRFLNSGTKTNADGFWLLRYDPSSLPGAGINVAYCSFAANGMSTSENIAGSSGTGPLTNSAIIAFGACVAQPGTAFSIDGTNGVNKLALTVVS
jgi:hypothetical protein